LPLKLHDAAFARMKRLSKPHKSQPNFSWDVPSAALTAKKRMVELLWVPVSCVNGNIHILPGVPRLFEAMLDGLKPRILPRLTDPEGKGVLRILITTPMAESEVAGYLTELANKVEPKGVKVGSYPRWGKDHNTVTLVGRDREYMESLVPEVEAAVQGRRVAVEGEDDADTSDKDS
jgi:molybdopterin-biosynthesis enzyme MoeA-like protein